MTECDLAELIHRTQNKGTVATQCDGKGIQDGCAE